MRFIRTHLMPALARLANRLPGWAYWRILWLANQKFLVGAVAVIRDEDGRVLLFRHTFRPPGMEWGLPGGWIQRGESIEQGLEREIYEESRLVVQIDGPVSVRAARRVARLDVIFSGHPLGGTFTPSNEVSEARYFGPDDLPPLIPDQERAINEGRKEI